MMTFEMEVTRMREFEPLHSIKAIDAFIQEHPLALLFVSKPHCSVCHGLLPQIKQLMGDFPEIQLGHVDASEVEKVAGRFHIFTVPVLLLFVEGKESIREARIVHMDLFQEKLKKIYENVVK